MRTTAVPTFDRSSLSRRQMLQVGALGTLGLSLPAALRAEAQSGLKVRAKSVIFLHQFGGPAAARHLRHEAGRAGRAARRVQADRLEPAGPQRLRAASPNVPDHALLHGGPLGEPPDRRAQLGGLLLADGHQPRSTSSPPRPRPRTSPPMARSSASSRPAEARVPTFVSLPWMIADGVFRTPGQFAGYLGKEHDPLFITKDPNSPSFSVEELTLPLEVPLERVSNRRALRSGLAAYAQLNESIAAVRGLDAYQQKALSLLTSSETQRAFDIQAEDPAAPRPLRAHALRAERAHGSAAGRGRRAVRDGLLLARASSAGTPTATTSSSFATGSCPTTEQTLPTLIEDLESRGLLDDTLVVWTGEFGRTPKINKDAGRDHWPQCYTMLMAGGGMKRGFVYGASDSTAAYPKDNPCTPDDISATMFYCMGIDPATELRNHVNQPIPVSRGTPIMPLLA